MTAYRCRFCLKEITADHVSVHGFVCNAMDCMRKGRDQANQERKAKGGKKGRKA